ncbi:MAG TPA: zf-HC2 domain-containing protein [Planctomycetota bacterium]|nr:zf-HC2 domain-containing protein [Planctomycetota bacterium]
MTCDEAIRAIEAMIDREIDDDERMQLEAHLAGCETCRRETEERRAFSDRIGRDLNDAFPPSTRATPRIVIRPRRSNWVRAAAVILVGFAVGYVGSSTGVFRPASAEAREVAKLSALKDAYQDRSRELADRVEREATALDTRAAQAPDGPRRDAVALCVMKIANGMAGADALELPPEPEKRARKVAEYMSTPSLARRGLAVQALRTLPATDMPLVERQIVNLKGTNRTFTELYVLSFKSPTEPVVVMELNGGDLRFTQLANATLRVEAKTNSATAAAAPRIYEGVNVLEFRSRHPDISRLLDLKGSDGNFSVAGVTQRATAVQCRPVAYMPAVVWSVQDRESGRIVEALSVHAVMAECARAGGTVEEAERQGLDVMRRVQEVSATAYASVTPDPERVRYHLTRVRNLDSAGLALTRERLHDDVAALERRVVEWQGRLECLHKAAVTLDYQPK